LGASEVNLLELATAYRTIASGLVTEPFVIRRIVRDSGEGLDENAPPDAPVSIRDDALSLIQEGLRGVVRIPTGTAHALEKETGGRLALPVFQELMLKVYRGGIVGPVPAFPVEMEERITRYLTPAPVVVETAPVDDAPLPVAVAGPSPREASLAELGWL
jgi:hypothetical protein